MLSSSQQGVLCFPNVWWPFCVVVATLLFSSYPVSHVETFSYPVCERKDSNTNLNTILQFIHSLKIFAYVNKVLINKVLKKFLKFYICNKLKQPFINFIHFNLFIHFIHLIHFIHFNHFNLFIHFIHLIHFIHYILNPIQFSTIEEPVRRKLQTVSVTSKNVSTMRGFQLLPSEVDFGVLKEGCTYIHTVMMKNIGIDNCRFKIRQPPPSTGMKVLFTPGPVSRLQGIFVSKRVMLR